ncbi:MAG: L-rhamnonate dehydratase, partial [bacterium]|nr:L-rhamnonate dehydratase [bacterium]
MKIVDVRAVHPEAPGAPEDWRSWLGQILVAVDTDEGLTGYGVGGGGAAGVHVVQTVLRSVLVGEDPTDVGVLWEKMYRATLPFGRKGLALMALSGVDLALWDLRGKRVGKPIVEVLGGRAGAKIPAYKTLFASDDVETAKKEAVQFRALKVHLGKMDAGADPERIVELVREMRESLGPEMQLMADAFMNWDVASTLKVAGRIAEYDLVWLEEPLLPDDLAGYEVLSRESPIPIAGGEHEFTAVAFEVLIQKRLHTILQPDVCWCGG